MDIDKLLVIIIQGGSFIAAFAAVSAGVVMANVTKKFGMGLLASGFKSISIGVFFIAAGIIADAVQSYVMFSIDSLTVLTIILAVKEILFVVGTYIIVIGSKKTGDQLENLTK